jgi:P-type Cu2+ transporter
MANLPMPEPMCCEGCRAVAELIAGAGLSDYYTYRQQPGNKPEVSVDRWQSYAADDIASAFVDRQNEVSSVVLLIGGLRCAACNWLIERHLRAMPGVLSVQVNAVTQRARIRWQSDEVNLTDILRGVAQLGYQPQPLNRQRTSDVIEAQEQLEQRAMLKRLGVAALGMMQVMMYVLPLYVRDQTHMDNDVAQLLSIISLLITTPVLLYSGWPFLRSAARAVRQRHINMDVPVALALLLAYAASVFNLATGRSETYFDSITMFIFLLTLGRYVEMRVRHRTGSATDALARMQPDVAHRLTDPAEHELKQEQWCDVPVSRLQVDDVLLVRAGEIIPADGVMLQGQSTINEALLTGESMPVNKQSGEALLAGSINVATPLRMRVTAAGERTLLSGLARLMEQAQFDKPHIARQADRVASGFLYAMLWLCLMTGMVWYFVNPARAFDAVLAVLVVTCPCALSLAAPTVIAAAISALAQRGVLVARADAIERLARVNAVWFDKTGTLTKGHMSVCSAVADDSISLQYALGIAAALEAGAQHPIADALRQFAAGQNAVAANANELEVVPGHGVQGRIGDAVYRLGRPDFAGQLRDVTTQTADDVIMLGDAKRKLAVFQLQDAVRTDAPACIHGLQQQGMQVALYSGDAQAQVDLVARQLGITDVHARQTPNSKLAALKASDQCIAMVGDGVNDAPVLAAAQVSIAMGQGAALAQASADMLLMSARLRSLPDALQVARLAQRIMRQNLGWAVAYNLCAVPLAACGFITPWLAALGMSVSSVLVTLNAARVTRANIGASSDAVTCEIPVMKPAPTSQFA